MSILNRKQIVHVTIGVSMSNPNGNIDNGEPRRTFNDCGIISAMSIKRKIRDLLEDHASPVTQQIIQKYGLDANACHIFESRSRGFSDCPSEKEAFKKALNLYKNSERDFLARYLDLRWFGGTILEENDKESKATGKKGKDTDSSDNSALMKFIRRGVVQVDMFSSVRPIETVIGGITRKASTQTKNQEGEGRDDSAGSMGQGAIRIVRNALYTGAIRISPFNAHQTNTSTADIELLKKLIPHIFLINATQRTGCDILQAVCLEHPDGLGVLNDYCFIEACRPRVKDGFSAQSPSESFDEYEVPSIDEIRTKIAKHKNGEKVTITNLLN